MSIYTKFLTPSITTLEDYKDRSLVLNTYPVSTTDFDLSNAEKDYLIEVARHAALEFLMQAEAKDSFQRLNSLRKQVDTIRQRRKSLKFTKSVLILGGILSIALAYVFSHQSITVYSDSESPKYINNYIDSFDTVQPLEKNAYTELNSYADQFSSTWSNGLFVFDSVFQVVNTNLTKPSSKVVIWDGHYPKHDELYNRDKEGKFKQIKISASSYDQAPDIKNPYIFVKNPGKTGEYNKLLDCHWITTSTGQNEIKEILKTTTKSLSLDGPCLNILKPGDDFKLVQIVNYGILFNTDKEVEPWVLYAHREVKPTGKSTYLLISDEVTDSHNLVYFNSLFIQKNAPEITHLLQPQADEPWDRTIQANNFIKNTLNEYNETDREILDLVFSKKIIDFAENKEKDKSWFSRGFKQWISSTGHDETKPDAILYRMIPFDAEERREVTDYKLVVFSAKK